MFAAHPILGVGLGGYWIGITAYHDASGLMTPQEAHNDYLELLSSGGVIGFAIGVWFVVAVVRAARRNVSDEMRTDSAGRDIGNRWCRCSQSRGFRIAHISKRDCLPRVDHDGNNENRSMSSALICGLSCLLILATLWQDIGGSLAFQGQDIIGGAAIIFKAPKRVKDLVGGAAAMMAVRRPPRSGRSSDVARNNRSGQATTRDDVAAAVETPGEQAETFKNEGNTLYDRGQYAQALEAYQKALKLTPQDPEAQASVGDTYLTLGRFAEAAAAYEQTVRLQADNAGAYSNLGYAYDKLGKVTESINALRNAVRLNSNDAIAFNNLGASLYKAGRYQEALDAFNNAVRLAPNDADALNNLGAVLYVLEQYPRALDSFQKAVAAKADSADAHYNLGNAYYMTGKHREATVAYRRAIQLRSDYVEARTNLGSLLISLGDLRGAIAELQESIRLRAGNPVAHNNLGYAYVKLGETLDRAAANQYLRQAVAAYQEALR